MPSQDINENSLDTTREILSSSGYADKAIDYYLNKANMGGIPNADQVTELTGPCGDTMRLFLKLKENRIEDAKIQVLGCPAAIASAMAAMDLIKGKTLKEAKVVKDRDIFRMLEDLPDQKQHCIRLTVKTLQKAIDDFEGRETKVVEGENSDASF